MKIVTTLFLLFFFYSVNAQEGNQFNPCTNFCSDLSTPKTSYLTDELTYYKAGSDNTCGSSTFNSFDVQYLKNSCGENAEHCTSNLCNLKIHVFYPSGISVNCKLPAVILFHGGAYNECGDYNDGGIIALAENFAVRGFVAFDVNYRVGVLSDPRLVSNLTIPDNNPVLKYVSAQQMLAIYRALQDAHGAIRSILTMQLDGTFLTKNKYQIDINKVFLGGVSAGSLIAFGAEYLAYDSPNQTKIDALFPNVSTALGPIDLTGVYYANKPANINQDYFGKIKGILNCWGALFLPNANLSNPYQFFSGQGYTLPPVISFCGKNDTVFNYISQGVYFSPNKLIKGIALNTESYCLPYSSSYTVPPDNNLRSPIKYETCIGSQTIYYMLKNSGILTEFYLDCQMYHGLDDDCDCDPSPFNKDPITHNCTITCQYQSDFGVSTNIDEATTFNYIIARAATFFQTILGGNTSHITTSRFVECENDRVGCLGDTHTSCSDNTECSN